MCFMYSITYFRVNIEKSMHLNASYSLLERFSGGFLPHTVGTIFKILVKCPCTYRGAYDIAGQFIQLSEVRFHVENVLTAWKKLNYMGVYKDKQIAKIFLPKILSKLKILCIFPGTYTFTKS